MTSLYRVDAYRVLEPHDAAEDYHAWIVTGDTVPVDRIGRLRSSSAYLPSHWRIAVCNNPPCPARARVNIDGLADHAIGLPMSDGRLL